MLNILILEKQLIAYFDLSFCETRKKPTFPYIALQKLSKGALTLGLMHGAFKLSKKVVNFDSVTCFFPAFLSFANSP